MRTDGLSHVLFFWIIMLACFTFPGWGHKIREYLEERKKRNESPEVAHLSKGIFGDLPKNLSQDHPLLPDEITYGLLRSTNFVLVQTPKGKEFWLCRVNLGGWNLIEAGLTLSATEFVVRPHFSCLSQVRVYLEDYDVPSQKVNQDENI
jgi:hypothetical protein